MVVKDRYSALDELNGEWNEDKKHMSYVQAAKGEDTRDKDFTQVGWGKFTIRMTEDHRGPRDSRHTLYTADLCEVLS